MKVIPDPTGPGHESAWSYPSVGSHLGVRIRFQ